MDHDHLKKKLDHLIWEKKLWMNNQGCAKKLVILNQIHNQTIPYLKIPPS